MLAILISALVALYRSIDRLIDPQRSRTSGLSGAGPLGFSGNEIAALIRLRRGGA